MQSMFFCIDLKLSPSDMLWAWELYPSGKCSEQGNKESQVNNLKLDLGLLP